MQTINLTEIDWNKLTPEEFSRINQQLIESRRIVKQSEKVKVVGGEKTQIVRLVGKLYEIKMSEFLRLKSLKSQKSKEKLIQQIISKYNPIEEF